ncbi:MAG TPA: metallophosphoesterase family protein [Verrucomicrobiae bacterium]|nr:metallophosphoesterase family protein [Verrucomicrobiae bacterium]
MKVGLLSDIHANLVALESVLAEMGPVDALWVCGDTVGYGPDPSDVLALLVERKATIVAGNHDRAVAAGEDLDFFNPPAAVAAKMHQAWLTSAERDLLAGLPRTLETGGVTLCHGSLRDPLWEYVTNPRSAAASLALARTAHCCAGHTHVPSLFRADAKGQPGRVQYETPYPLAPRAFVNPGSVGQPRDGDPRAAYAVLDLAPGTVTFHRSPYQFAQTQRRIRERGLPSIFADRLAFGL